MTSSSRCHTTRLGGLSLVLAGMLATPAAPLLAQGQDAKELQRHKVERETGPGKEDRPVAREDRQANPPVQVKEARPVEAKPANPSVQVKPVRPAEAQPTPAQPVPGRSATVGEKPSAQEGRPAPAGSNQPVRPATGWPTGGGASQGQPGVQPRRPVAGETPNQVHLQPAPQIAPPRPAPGIVVTRPRDGGEIHRAPGGAVREIYTPGGAVVHVAPDGMRRMEVQRPDGRVVVAQGGGHVGYVQRPIYFHDRPLVQRTYVVGGVVATRVYRPVVYRGLTINLYMTNHYYHPEYYAWTYRPWARPVAYRWGWAGRPWCGYYRTYYAPYPYYTSPIFWLTDFVFAVTFEEAYQNRVDSGMLPPPPDTSQPGLTPEVKQAIADEVRLELAEERDAQANGGFGEAFNVDADAAPPLFSGNVSRIFLVSHSLVAYDHGRECTLSEGDVLQLNGPPPPRSIYADVVVMASRNGSLPRGRVVSVSLQDLQEIHNQMQANLDRGLGDLQAHPGQDGLPPPPPQALGGHDADYYAGVQPDPNAAGELSQAALEASRDSQALLGQAAPALPPAPAPAPAPVTGGTVTLGMTIDQVRGILGDPRRSADVGSKRIDVYQDFKVTFMNGRVTDIE